MIERLIRNNLRRPLYSIAVLAFAVVMTVVLCYLHQSAEAERQSYEETFKSVPVVFRVTDLDGSKPDEIGGWIVDLFTGQGTQPTLESFVGELYTRVTLSGFYNTFTPDGFGGIVDAPQWVDLAGIGSLYVAEELTEDWGGEICWKEGYDESIFATEENVCLMPESMKDMEQIELNFQYIVVVDNVVFGKETSRTLQVVGYYIDRGNQNLYTPYAVVEQISAELARPKEITEICAVLKDNHDLEALNEVVAQWFAEPNPTGAPTEWGRFGYQYYPYAMDVNDIMLRNLKENMQTSMRLNQLASLVVFILSAGAGFLTGFLVIRARKREIALMRTMGASHVSIFVELALEQFLCILAGIALGGAVFLWQPMDQLAIFAGIYFVGLSIALVIFLCKNLLTTIKEDE